MKNSNNLNPVATYENAKLKEKQIMQENKGKTGIYRWVNKINGKTYVGSAVEIVVRLYAYYSVKRLNGSNMAIYKALLKYGHSNFRLEIIEYCEPENAVSREQYYIDLLKGGPDYNLNPIAGSRLGYKHNQESKRKISA